MSKKRKYVAKKERKIGDAMSIHTTLDEVTKNIKVVKADLEDIKKLFKESFNVSDIKDKVVVVRIDYTDLPVEKVKDIQQSLYAVNQVLFENNSAFIILPDDGHIKSVTVGSIDGVIKSLEALKEKINEDNSNAGV